MKKGDLRLVVPPNFGWLEYTLNSQEMDYVWRCIKNKKESLKNDLAGNPIFAEVCGQYESILRKIVDPEDADRKAKDDQNDIVEFHGGREKVLRDKMGIQSYTPAPKL